MTEFMAGLADSSPKAKRLSMVAVTGAGLAVVWSIADVWLNVPSTVVASTTGLFMLVAGFIDFKHEDDHLFDGDTDA